MAKVLQLRRGNTAGVNALTGAEGELSYDTQAKFLRIHDGSTAGGFIIPKLVSGKIPFAQLDIQDATTSQKGIVQLSNALTSSSTTLALTAAQGAVLYNLAFGVDQAWVDVTSSRSSGVTYTNTTGRPIVVMVTGDGNNSSASTTINVGGVNIGAIVSSGSFNIEKSLSFVVPNGTSYTMTGAFVKVAELR